MAERVPLIIKDQLYRNTKTQKIYIVVDADALDVSYNRDVHVVVYREMEGVRLFVRGHYEFAQKFEEVRL